MDKKLLAALLGLYVLLGLILVTPIEVSAQTDNLKILSYSYYMDMLGNIVVVGEVQNTGNTIIEYAIIAGAITGSDGSYVEAGNRAWALNILPGEKAPFYLDFLAQYTNSQTWYVGVSNIELNVYRAPSTTQYQYQEVIILNDKPAPSSSGEYWINGELKNNGNQNAANVTVLATFYNSSGTVVATGFSNTLNNLAAGESKSFKVAAFDLNQTIIDPNQKIVGYSLRTQVQAPMQMQTGTAPTVNPTVIPAPTFASTPVANGPGISVDQNLISFSLILVAILGIAGFVFLKRRLPKNKSTLQDHSAKNKKQKKR